MAEIKSKTRKKAVNLTVDSEILEKARSLGLNLSGEFESRLAEAVRDAERERWLKANEEAIRDYNRHISEHGLFSDGKRQF